MRKNIFRRAAALLAAAFVFLAAPLPARAADGDVLAGIDRLQGLARAYDEETEGEQDTVLLTVNYLRQHRYTDFSWDLVLGPVDQGFTDYVSAHAPELEQLQSVLHAEMPGGHTVDLLHMMAGLGGAYQDMGILCTWGGDCIQLAEMGRGYSTDPAACYENQRSAFANPDDNVSLFPLSDLTADLDGAVLGMALPRDGNLARAMEKYYEEITPEQRARRFVSLQFGDSDTGDTAAFREAVWQAFHGDAGVQLFLTLKEYMSRDGSAILPEMEAPLRASTDLLADHLAAELGGARVRGEDPHSAPQPEKPARPEADREGTGPEGQKSFDPRWLLVLAGVLLVLAALSMVWLIVSLFRPGHRR